MFLQCIDSLLIRNEEDAGFRGVQSKSLMDIIQLESLSHSSSVLKITNGSLVAKIWFENGEIIDAEAPEMKGEAAVRKVLSWKTGAFEILPAELNRSRKVQTSVQGLLLESAQAMDEAQANQANPNEPEPGVPAAGGPESPLTPLTRFDGVEFVMTLDEQRGKAESWSVENPQRLADWLRDTTRRFQLLGESLHAGALKQYEGLTSQNHLVVVPRDEATLCAGFDRSPGVDAVRETSQKLVALWLS